MSVEFPFYRPSRREDLVLPFLFQPYTRYLLEHDPNMCKQGIYRKLQQIVAQQVVILKRVKHRPSQMFTSTEIGEMAALEYQVGKLKDQLRSL